jgi:hypothetical protein
MEDVGTISGIVLRQTAVLMTLGVFGFLLVPAALVAARRARWSRWRVTYAGLAGVGVAAILATTLGRSGIFVTWDRGCGLAPGLPASSPEALLNLVLFVPASVFGALALRRPLVVVVLAVALSVGVEAVQSVTGVGTCQAADVMRNVSGAFVAAVFARMVLAIRGRLRLGAALQGEC